MKHINLDFKNHTELYTFGTYKSDVTKMLCHKIKQDSNYCIHFAADILSSFLIEFAAGRQPCNDFYLVPVPGHNGYSAHTKRICDIINENTHIRVNDCIFGKRRISQYFSKKFLGKVMTSEDFELGFKNMANLDGTPILIDVIADTGETLRACADLFDKDVFAVTLCVSERMAKEEKALF